MKITKLLDYSFLDLDKWENLITTNGFIISQLVQGHQKITFFYDRFVQLNVLPVEYTYLHRKLNKNILKMFFTHKFTIVQFILFLISSPVLRLLLFTFLMSLQDSFSVTVAKKAFSSPHIPSTNIFFNSIF